jgi:hypothetical protein
MRYRKRLHLQSDPISEVTSGAVDITTRSRSYGLSAMTKVPRTCSILRIIYTCIFEPVLHFQGSAV